MSCACRLRPYSEGIPHFSGIRASIIAFALLAILLAGCSKKEATQAPKAHTPRVTLLEPHNGQVAADTLRVQVAIESGDEIDRAALLVNSRSVATLWEPPWSFSWVVEGITDSSWVTVEVLAYDIQGDVGRSTQIQVLLVPNHPPLVRILYPYPDHHIPSDGLGQQPWTCLAVDPDEGKLPNHLITWVEEGRHILGVGSQIIPASLAAGIRSIQVEARDSWGRRVIDRQRVVIFDYPPLSEPTDIAQLLELAFRARDVQKIGSLLHPNFQMHSCSSVNAPGPPAPPPSHHPRDIELLSRLDRSMVLAAFSRLLEDPDLYHVSWMWNLATVEPVGADEDDVAKLEFDVLDVTLKRWSEGSLDHLTSRRNRARLYLRREDSTWKLWEWLSLPSRSPYPEDVDFFTLLSHQARGVTSATAAVNLNGE